MTHNRPSIFPRLTYLAVFTLTLLALILLPCPASAQWSEDGVLMIDWSDDGWACCPDGQGGAWYAMNYGSVFEQQIAVQHVDADGYTAFPPEGVLISDSTDCWLLGIEQGLDGDCIIIFLRDITGDPYRFTDLFAQRMTQQGERLWGQGILASNSQTPSKISIEYYSKWTVSDDAGGAWVVWHPNIDFIDDIYLGGINADGTLKYPDHDRLMGESHISQISPNGIICADGEGGAIVLLGQSIENNSIKRMLVQRVDAAGNKYHIDPQVVLEWPTGQANGYARPYFLARDPQGGFVVTTKWYWQRISDDLTPQWAIRGVPAYDCEPDFLLTYVTNPVVMADRSVVQLGIESAVEELRVEQFDFDGNRVAGTDWGPYAGDPTFIPNNLGPLLPSPDRESVISNFRAGVVDEVLPPMFRLIQRLTPTGDNLWQQITAFGNEEFNPYASEWSSFYMDDEHICLMLGDSTPQDYRRHFAFKLNVADGSVAGFDTTSSPIDPVELPSSPAMISNAYPNPFNATVALTISVRDPGVYDLIVHNVLGQTIHRESVDCGTPGEVQQILTMPDGSASGIYVLTLQHRDGRHLSQKKVVYLR